MEIKKLNFLEYLSAEEQNLLIGMVNFRQEFDLFDALDRVYREPLGRLDVRESEAVIPQLYLFVHFHLYFGFSCLLRAHLSESLTSIRKAIDAALTAYELILAPEKTKAYIERDSFFLFIKANVKRSIEIDSKSYPLAHELIKLHEDCSEYGSHADISSFFHRLEVQDGGAANKLKLLVHYFQYPRNREQYKFYILMFLYSFILIFKIFKEFLDKNFKIVHVAWEQDIKILSETLPQKMAAVHRAAQKNS